MPHKSNNYEGIKQNCAMLLTFLVKTLSTKDNLILKSKLLNVFRNISIVLIIKITRIKLELNAFLFTLEFKTGHLGNLRYSVISLPGIWRSQ